MPFKTPVPVTMRSIGWIPLLICFFFCSGASFADTALRQAAWLRDPVFQGVPVLNLFHREKDPAPKAEGPAHVHTLFRREVTLADTPVRAILLITADDYVKFYINGYFAVQGPAPSYHFAHHCLEMDVSSFLKKGRNSLAAHVYYQGLVNRVWNSGDNRSGFAAVLQLTYADGRTDEIVTDEQWRCHSLQAFTTGEIIGYRTQFQENIDMRLMPRGWRTTGFGDLSWTTPLAGGQDHVFIAQPTPPLQVSLREPARTQEGKKGRYLYDFGQTIVGAAQIRLQGKKGHKIIVRHGEELQPDGWVRYEMRANCRYEETCILSGDPDLIEFYDYRSFRYLEILNAPEAPEVRVAVRHYPFQPEAVSFRSENKLLEQIWAICQQGVVMGSQEVFVDCPSREKGQYLGDTLITARSHMWLTADPRLTNQAIRAYVHSACVHPGLMAVAPGSFMQEIAEYSLQFPLLLLHYYQMSGDRDTVEKAVDSVFSGLFDYFAGFENERGLLAGISKETGKWVLVDWPENLRDNYDYEYSLQAGNTVLNAFYYGALRTAAALERILGRNGKTYDQRAEKLAESFARHLVNPATGLYVDAPGSQHSSLHANAVPLFFGLTAGADKDAMLNLIREKKLSCGVYMASFVIEACFKAGAPELGFSLLCSQDEHSWHEMIRHGATTCLEAWGPDQKWNTSWLHPWSSSPIYLLAQYVFGISPAEAGWKRIRFAPAEIPGLPAMSLRLPLPGGRSVSVNYDPEKGYSAMFPPDISVDKNAAPGSKKGIGTEALKAANWQERVGAAPGLWVSIPEQRLYIIESGQVLDTMVCSTALRGMGSVINSQQTPPGWHRITGKIGDGEPVGRVFRSRQATKELWKPGMTSKEDLVVTRIFILDGLEDGLNRGKDDQGRIVDSRQRFIYIHGTNHEEELGTPGSQGCIRLANDDVVTLFNRIPEGTLVYIEP
ncbi:MAG TPA: family 78 glycoside hydrolase catalytic domain [Candidatus Hydrogenedentes bacterium]|nr:family 78 glycoside hydrolase catalytic domain [Candidatus Hydrogenedentota bacterium]